MATTAVETAQTAGTGARGGVLDEVLDDELLEGLLEEELPCDLSTGARGCQRPAAWRAWVRCDAHGRRCGLLCEEHHELARAQTPTPIRCRRCLAAGVSAQLVLLDSRPLR